MKSLTNILRKGRKAIATGAAVVALSYAALPFCAMAKEPERKNTGIERRVSGELGECPYELKWIKTSEEEGTTDVYTNDLAIDPDGDMSYFEYNLYLTIVSFPTYSSCAFIVIISRA